MKYLIKHKLFETRLERDIKEIEDALIYLRDEGFNINITVANDYGLFIYVRILDYLNKPVKWIDIKDDVERSVEVATLNNFAPITVYYKEIQKDGRIFNRHDRESVNWACWKDYALHKDITIAFLSIEFSRISYK